MEFDPFVLSRLQFAANISFHILFPTISLGLAWVLVFFRVKYTLSNDKVWEYAYYFWVKIFALTFAIGVVTGITMSFQFGTNWPGFMDKVGNIAGPLLGYEVLTAFFLEASFLGIMLFGKARVSNRIHLLATTVVAIGTSLSAFWILSLNSWMQTPAGFRIENGVAFVNDWSDVIFNASFPYRFSHMFTGSLLTTAFFVAGVCAYRMLIGVDGPATMKVLKSAIFTAAILAPTQIFIGDLHGLNTLEHQPAKIAAIEAVWETEKGAPLVLFGFPNEETQQTDFAIEIPNFASYILTHEWDGELKGLNEFEGEHPPVAAVFWSFRVMVSDGMLMLLVSWVVTYKLINKQELSKNTLWILSIMTFSGWVGVLSGWYVTEMGRQPWVVYGLIKTKDVVADHPSGTLLITLIAYLLLYAFIMASYIGALRYLSGKPSQSRTIHEYKTDDVAHTENN